MPVTKLYRYEDFDLFNPTLKLRVFNVIRETPRGWWILDSEDLSAKQKWVGQPDPDGAGKRYAYPRLDHAWQSYKIRKWKHENHLREHLARVQIINQWVEEQTTPPVPLERAPARDIQSRALRSVTERPGYMGTVHPGSLTLDVF